MSNNPDTKKIKFVLLLQHCDETCELLGNTRPYSYFFVSLNKAVRLTSVFKHGNDYKLSGLTFFSDHSFKRPCRLFNVFSSRLGIFGGRLWEVLLIITLEKIKLKLLLQKWITFLTDNTHLPSFLTLARRWPF